MTFDNLFLTGCVRTDITYSELLQCELHVQALDAFMELQKQGASAGFNVQIASAYRDFDRQRQIWNAKASGQRPVRDRQGKPLDITVLSEWETVQAILNWSALPGASRHHWGTDLDVFDADCLPLDYHLQLTQAEYQTGVQVNFNRWLDNYLQASDARFFRPYTVDCGGVAPEPWHISYQPLAQQFQMALTPAALHSAIATADILLKSTVLTHLDTIYHRYVQI